MVMTDIELSFRIICECVEIVALCLSMCLWMRSLTELKQVLGAIAAFLSVLAREKTLAAECTAQSCTRGVSSPVRGSCSERQSDGNKGLDDGGEGQTVTA